MYTTIEKMLLESGLRDSIQETPCYIINQDILRKNVKSLVNAFNKVFDRFAFGYSYKTNYTPAVLATVHELGGYAEVVSPLEYCHALTLGIVDYSKIIYNGVIPDVQGKYKVASKGGIVNVENLRELCVLNEYARAEKSVIKVGIRVNISLSDHVPSRFGIEITPKSLSIIRSLKNLRIVGIHCHISKGRSISCWRERAEKMGAIAKELGTDYIDFGGNMYGPMNPLLASQFGCEIPTFDDYAKCIHDELSKIFREDEIPMIIVEPGTPLISNAQSYLTKVVDIKQVAGKTICTLDGKSLDVTMIGDSGKQFPMYVFNHGNNQVSDAAFYGCTCLEPDKFSDGYTGCLSVGDHVLFDNIGSYSNVLAPRFIQAVPAIYSYDNGTMTLAKERDDWYDVFRLYL